MPGSRPASPAPKSPLPPALVPVRVPLGYYPIEVVQYWRGEYAPGHPLPLHWAILVRTSAERGNCHEIVGDINTYTTQDRFDIPLPLPPHHHHHHRQQRTGDAAAEWRGSHVVGYVSPARLDDLLNRIALVPVVRRRLSWNCQSWVYEALRGLTDPELYTDVNMTTPGVLQAQMGCLLDAWEMGDI